MAERIEIPDHRFEAKRFFAEPQGREIVEEIREWVKDNPAYRWRGHAHSKPPPDELAVKLLNMCWERIPGASERAIRGA